ncbi:hypothetical protein GCM10023169_23930 [Georgenia halophila]|uniref:ATPase BadF/BadG/BcrA/BcrD type domain-containing protein n=1 Tax=Georgenia halophila TaxID=620889 RepID=A0ABP8LBJ8_9MICO
MSHEDPLGSAAAGVDVGGGGIRIRVERDGRSAEQRRDIAIPRRGGRIDVPAVCGLILDGLDGALDEVDATGLTRVGIGLTGLPGLVEDSEEFWRRLKPDLGIETLVVASDALTTHVGALGGEAGSVVAAGTGMITLGTDLDRIWNQADGWGVLLGDEGSGAWIGRQGLQAALRSYDGRPGGSAKLRTRMYERFGDPLEVINQVYPAESPANQLASFAPAVEAAAAHGDPVAAGIWLEAGTLLGSAAVAALRGLPPRISWGGGLFNAGHLLLDPFREEIRRSLPEAEVLEPVGTALQGALLLARRAADGRVATHEPHLYVFG